MIYFLIFFIILLLALKYDFRSYKGQNQWINVILIMFVLLAGLRYRVGTDTLVYMDEYDSPNNLSFIKDKYLIGWYLFIKLCHQLHFSFYIVQFIVAIVINYGIVKFLKTNYPQAIFSSLLIYYALLYPGWNFEVLRQAICVSIFLYSLSYLKTGRYIRYYVFNAITCTIHETSLLLLIVPLLTKIKINRKTLTIFVLFIFAFIVAAPFVRDQVLYYSLILSPFKNKAAHYFDAINLNSSFNISQYLFNMILNVLLPLWAITKNLKTKQFPNSFIVLALFSLVTYSLSTMLPMMYRLNFFFSLFSLLLVIYLLSEISQSVLKSCYRILFFVLFIVFVTFKGRIYFVEKNNIPAYVHYYPYTNIFNEKIVPEREAIDNKW